ncbi:methyltransferase-like protein 6 isoform X2 [Amborella trichopoda]|uniref:methyltransferase-like protein 6 isoform X2 n=1 Tax=Amborella trichopoda TaxID=13333 RepID=UPI0009BFC0AC|nr:methyltransferase-like protein 6 isoform X2 [Amborella trichopoda]|eukprot:XP_020526800.1 methyltransferase-like protein 6 isoform X2 [Amborella trichopoda]
MERREKVGEEIEVVGARYYSKDFEWENLRHEVENSPSLRHHCQPHIVISSSSSSSGEDAEAWKSFHNRHSRGRFFKERRYLLKEFPELLDAHGWYTILEVGCGNGSSVLPILRAKDTIVVYACDCSMVALERAKEAVDAAEISQKLRFHPFYCDFSIDGFPSWIFCNACREKFHVEAQNNLSDVVANEEANAMRIAGTRDVQCCIGGVDFVTLIFTLSSVPFRSMPFVIANCYSVLKPGSLLLFRDYGLYDMTMLRFLPTQRVGNREYKRADGTRSYFFSLDTVRDLFLNAGFIEPFQYGSPLRHARTVVLKYGSGSIWIFEKH